MAKKRKPRGYWTKERSYDEAKRYKSRTEFQKKAGRAYDAALRNKWLDEICSHMEEIKKPNGFWTKERCSKEAKRYKSRTEFSIKSRVGYNVAWKNKWLDEICGHMEEIQKPHGFWTKEKCSKEAKKYKSRTEFKIKLGGAYRTALRNKWLDEICSHMKEIRKPHGFWTKEKCSKEAKRYKSRIEFKKKNDKHTLQLVEISGLIRFAAI